MPTPTKEELSERSQLVRCYEASCRIEYPTDEERNFRAALQKKIGLSFYLKEVRGMTIDAPKK